MTLDDTTIFNELIISAGIFFFKHNKKNDSLDYDMGQCKTIFPHIKNFKKCFSGKDFYKNILKKDRLSLKNYLSENTTDKNHTKYDHVDVRYIHAETDEILWLRIHILSTRNSHNDVYRYGSIQNITKDKSELIKTAQFAYRDNLTGLINRERMKQKLSLALYTAHECSIEHSVIAINIDYLGIINTMFGYEITNDLIEEVANLILLHKRDTDVIARIASGKFVILLLDTSREHCERIGERILNTIRNTNFKTRSGLISVTASASGCHIPHDTNSADKILSILEEGLTKAKKRGRDNFVKYNKEIQNYDAYQKNIVIASQIIKAIQNNTVYTAYQPILHAHDTSKNFMECLARIKDDAGNYIPAYHFISIAESIGFIKHIDFKLCENALDDLLTYPHLKLSVNFSGHTLYNLNNNSPLMQLLKTNSSVAPRLCIEFTETIPLQEIENIHTIIKSIKEMGYRIALDDFGAGYNSFLNLNQFDFDMVKIDGAYIKNIAQTHKNQIFTETLTNLSKKLNLDIVAEMIDNEADLNFVKSLNIDYYQGYYFAQPSVDFDAMNKLAYGIDNNNNIKKVI